MHCFAQVDTERLSWQPRDRIGLAAQNGETLDCDHEQSAGDGDRRIGEAMKCNEPTQTKQLCAFDLLAASLPHIDSDDDGDTDDQPSAKLVLTSNEREALYNLTNKPSNKRQSIILGNLISLLFLFLFLCLCLSRSFCCFSCLPGCLKK